MIHALALSGSEIHPDALEVITRSALSSARAIKRGDGSGGHGLRELRGRHGRDLDLDLDPQAPILSYCTLE